jgi:hypothetical protein
LGDEHAAWSFPERVRQRSSVHVSATRNVQVISQSFLSNMHQQRGSVEKISQTGVVVPVQDLAIVIVFLRRLLILKFCNPIIIRKSESCRSPKLSLNARLLCLN